MLANLRIGNVLEMVALSDLYGADQLRSLALEFIVENGSEILSQDGWKDKLKKYPDVVVDLLETMASTRSSRKQGQGAKLNIDSRLTQFFKGF